MQIFDQRALGIIMLVLIAFLVITKRMATGSLLRDKPSHGFWLWIVHIFNMLFLLIINPLTAVLLTIQKMETIDTTRIAITEPAVSIILEIMGLIMIFDGYILMALALIKLSRNYQVGGQQPRKNDRLSVSGPYRFIRHPMYTSVLCISLGLALVLHSTVFLALFLIYLILIILLIPCEEKGLEQNYGDDYIAYRRKVKRLIPYIY